MVYEIIHKPAFDAQFINLSKNLQRLVVKAIDDLRENAETPRGETIVKLRDYTRLWRYRKGDLRIIYGVTGSFVQLLAVGDREDIYDTYYDAVSEVPNAAGFTAIEELLAKEKTVLPAWLRAAIEDVTKARDRRDVANMPLPQKLTEEKLTRWRVPLQYQAALLSCHSENELLKCMVPPEIVERVLEQLYPRPVEQVAQQPDLQLIEAEDLVRYAEGDLLGFLLKLDTDQERHVGWALDGPTLVKGGPGSGKSTVALYRAKKLIQRGAGTVLFTTYTNALVEFSRQLLKQLIGTLPAEIRVSTLDSIAVQIVQDCDQHRLNIGGSNEIKAGLRDAHRRFLQENDSKYELALLAPDNREKISLDYLVEEIEWVIEGRGLGKKEEYMPDKTDRTGRVHRFDVPVRQAMWRIYRHVCKFLEERGIVTWGYVRSRALELVQSGQWPQRWKSVIVDEAQDLTPTALALCIELCEDSRGVFLTADASQSLYNRGFRWKDVHESLRVVGRTRILRTNYRSTHQIAEAAGEILRGSGAGDEEALDQNYVHLGPRPEIRVCADTDEQLLCLSVGIQEAARQLRLPIGAAAILTPTNQLAEETARALTQWGVPAHYMPSRELDLHYPGVKVLTIYSAKGLEFPIVAVPYVDEHVLPCDTDKTNPEEIVQHLAAERRVFFVGCTRAMRRLMVTCLSSEPSPFLEGLSKAAWRWE